MDRFDAAIIGAGPAGCLAARRLALGGARVALIDGSHPREKPCGGGVTGRASDLVRETGAALRITPVTVESAVFEHFGHASTTPLSGARGRSRLTVVPRRDFDGALRSAAGAAGAHLVPERVVDVTPGAHAWTVRTRAGEIEATWLLGADGPNSLVRRRLSRPFDRADLSIATGFFLPGAAPPAIDIHFHADPAGYLWSFPRHDHLAVGICAQADASTPGVLLPRVSAWLDSRRPGAAETVARQRYSWPIPSLTERTLRRDVPAGDRWMLLGDAAGLVDPITREGIYFALRSGEIAASCLADGRDPAARYAARVDEEIRRELIRAAQLKARFFRPQFMALLIGALQRSPGIRAVMVDLVAGEQPYRGLRRRLLRTFEWRLMAELFTQRAK